MVDRKALTTRVASFKKSASRLFDKAVDELVALAFKHANAGADFLWDMDPGLDEEANKICRNLSDAMAEKAKELARLAVEDSFEYEGFDDAWEHENDGLLTILDQQGSFLKELLEIWVALAFVNAISKGELRVMLSRYMANPFLSPLWGGLPKGVLKWGRGYQRDLLAQFVLIGQEAVIRAFLYAEWKNASANGAKYYIRRRGSWYDCRDCDDLCGFPIPIETPFQHPHPRCMCWPEYHYE